MTISTNYGTGALVGVVTHENLSATSDTARLPFTTRAVFCGTAGTVRLETVDGSLATYTVPAGYLVTGFFVRVYATGTTIPAADIVIIK